VKMTKETIIKEDGRLLVYYRFDHASNDAETRQSQHGDVKPSGKDPSESSSPSA
jgi:hypothetical protein